MKTYQIYPLWVGESKLPAGFISTYICYLIKGDDALVLVDTGTPDNEWSAKYHYQMMMEKNSRELLVEKLAELNIKPEDIKVLVLTHLHWDHSYNADLFPNARIYIQQKEIKFAIDPLPSHYHYYEALQTGMTPPWLKIVTQIESIDGDYDLCDGIQIVALPGHSPGFQGVLVNTTKGRYLIASDAIPFMGNWEDRQFGLPKPSGIFTDLHAYYDSLKKMITIANYVLPGHDKKVFEHSVYP